jgi:colanic acid/amylovoran biosynthesis glycosyltransferase
MYFERPAFPMLIPETESSMSFRNKRIVLIVPVFPQLSETFITRKFFGLIDKGWDLHVVCKKSPEANWAHFPELQGRHLRRKVHVNWPSSSKLLELLCFPIAFILCLFQNPGALVRYLKTGFKTFGAKTLHQLYLDSKLIGLKPDAIHFEFGALAKNRTYLKEVLGCKLFVSFYGYDLNVVGLDQPDYYTELWNKADGIHLVSRAMSKRAAERGLQPKRPYWFITPPVQYDYFDPGKRSVSLEAGTAERRIRILSVGRLVWEKGYEYGLKAIQLLVQSGIHCEYRIVGDGTLKSSLILATHDLHLQQHVTFLSAQPIAEVKKVMQWADIFLQASVSEGFPVAILEAQSMALPIVCSDAGGTDENVLDGETGFVVPTRDPHALSEKLVLLSRDPALRAKMGESGRKRVMTHFRFEDQIALWDRFLSESFGMESVYQESMVSDHAAPASGDVQ